MTDETLPLDTVLQGDNVEVMKTLADNSIDAIVCDPPYAMGEIKDIRGLLQAWILNEDGQAYNNKQGFMNATWDTTVEVSTWQECYRVLKPGGFLLAFSSTRTYDLLVIALRLANFTIKDTVMWLHGQGFPKSLNIGKVTGLPEHQGLGTALKPSVEPICVAQKPLSERTIAANVLRWGTGGLNIDACRVNVASDDPNKRQATGENGNADSMFGVGNHTRPATLTGKRWPANTVLSHSPACRRIGTKRVRGDGHKAGQIIAATKPDSYGFASPHKNERHQDSDGMEEVESWECSDDCPVYHLDRQSGIRKSGGGDKHGRKPSMFMTSTDWEQFKHTSIGGDTGTASRYFHCFPPDTLDAPFLYASKASKRERDAGLEHLSPAQGFDKNTSKQIAHVNPDTDKTTYSDYTPSARHNTHPTVKNLSLMRHLVRLVGVPDGVVLDPFFGSGSTGVACVHEGMHFIGVEREQEYVDIARARIAHAHTQVRTQDTTLWHVPCEDESEVA